MNIVSLWDKELQMAPDPTKGGQKGPCLVGRMLLFSKEHKASKAVCCEGHLTINLWDERPGALPQSVEWWKIDKETLRKMAVKDELGWGYTLALPTEKAQYISKGRVELVFEPDHGDKMFASSGPMWFTTTNITVNSRTETPFKSTIVPPGQQLGQPNYQPQQQPLQPQQQPQQPFQNGQPRQQSFQGPAQQQFAPLQQVGLQQVQPFTPGQQPQQLRLGKRSSMADSRSSSCLGSKASSMAASRSLCRRRANSLAASRSNSCRHSKASSLVARRSNSCHRSKASSLAARRSNSCLGSKANRLVASRSNSARLPCRWVFSCSQRAAICRSKWSHRRWLAKRRRRHHRWQIFSRT